jgi:hypothetical protein
LNWIQIQLKIMRCKSMQKVYWKNSCDFGVEKKKLSKEIDSEKID